MIKTFKIDVSEKQILKGCKHLLTILERQGKLAFTRIHVMPVIRSDYRGRKKFMPNVDMIGFSDIEIVANGKIAYVELKTKKGKLSKPQELFLKNRAKHGAIVSVIRSVDELVLFLKMELGVNAGF